MLAENYPFPFVGVKFFISKSLVIIDSSTCEIFDYSGLAFREATYDLIFAAFPWMISSALPCIVYVLPVLVGP